jgi:uncharacterized membrane protein
VGVLATSIYMIVFRVIHVLLAIAWGGALFLLVVFLQPTAKAIGPAAGPFMRELLAVRHLTDWLLRIAGATIVAGGFLYWHDMQAFGGLGDFLGSAFGLWLTIGALAAIVAVAIGGALTKPMLERSLAIGARIAQAGDQPPPELVQELAALQAKGRSFAILNLALVTLAAFAMSTARYW